MVIAGLDVRRHLAASESGGAPDPDRMRRHDARRDSRLS